MAGVLANRVALVTGAAGGIGRQHALRLAAEGEPVIRYDERQVGVTWDEAHTAGRNESEVA